MPPSSLFQADLLCHLYEELSLPKPDSLRGLISPEKRADSVVVSPATSYHSSVSHAHRHGQQQSHCPELAALAADRDKKAKMEKLMRRSAERDAFETRS